jgi:hypothetical protein
MASIRLDASALRRSKTSKILTAIGQSAAQAVELGSPFVHKHFGGHFQSQNAQCSEKLPKLKSSKGAKERT